MQKIILVKIRSQYSCATQVLLRVVGLADKHTPKLLKYFSWEKKRESGEGEKDGGILCLFSVCVNE
jgi:hypothetical protein